MPLGTQLNNGTKVSSQGHHIPQSSSLWISTVHQVQLVNQWVPIICLSLELGCTQEYETAAGGRRG